MPDSAPDEVAFSRLIEGLRPVLEYAEANDVTLGFEPEPGMFIDTFARFAELDARLDHPRLQLTVDIGHVHCLEPGPIGGYIRDWAARIVNVHVEDMKRGVHDHLMFGEGTVDFADALGALRDVGYQGGLHVELSRHSHMAVEAVRRSAIFLRPFVDGPFPDA